MNITDYGPKKKQKKKVTTELIYAQKVAMIVSRQVVVVTGLIQFGWLIVHRKMLNVSYWANTFYNIELHHHHKFCQSYNIHLATLPRRRDAIL